jgi:hypothetical protein
MADITLPEQWTLSYTSSLQERVLTPQTVALGEGGWNRGIRWQEIRLMDAWMSGELGGS